MRQFTKEEVDSMDLEDAQHAIENCVYEATALIEQLEQAGKVGGNGHHCRQKLAAAAKDEVAGRWTAD